MFPELADMRMNYSSYVVFAHLYVNSIRYKMSEIGNVQENVDIFCLTETKIDDSFPNAVSSPRLQNVQEGSYLIWRWTYHVRQFEDPSRNRQDLIDFDTQCVECIVVETSIRNERTFFILVYKNLRSKTLI